MILWRLFLEFFKIGLFAVGGGMATIPFLEHLSQTTGWFPISFISDMIAISESTPGPIGINMATYVGYNTAGVLGGLVATLGVTLPSIVIVIIASKSLEKLQGNKLVDNAFYGLRPAVTGLIAVAGLMVMKNSFLYLDPINSPPSFSDLVDINKLIFFVIIFIAIIRYKKHPVLYIVISALVGIVFRF